MSKNLTYLDWLKQLPISDTEYAQCICPACTATGLSYQYFGFTDSEFGWKLVWCPICLNGIRISRTKVPNIAQALISDKDQKQFLDQHTGINFVA